MSTSSTFASFKVFSSSKSSISPPISSITAFVVVLAPSLFSPSSSLPKKPASFGGFGMFAKNPMMRRLSFFLLLLARCFFLSRAAEREKADQNRRLSDVSFFSNSPFSSSEWKKKNDVFAKERIKRKREKENALSRLLFCFFFFLCFFNDATTQTCA